MKIDIPAIMAKQLDKCMELGISQMALQRLSGVNQSNISKFFGGKKDITVKTAQKLVNGIHDWERLNRHAIQGKK